MTSKKTVTECEACKLEAEWNKVFDPRMDEIIDVICDATGKPEVDDEVWRVVHDVCYDLACAVLGFPGAPLCRAHGTPIPECENCPDCAALRAAPWPTPRDRE